MKSKFIIFVVIAVLFVIALGVFTNKSGTTAPNKYDDFAKALTTRGAQFYGAFWCPHCQDQKALFGSAKQYLPYIECSKPDQTPTQVCLDKKIESYPTWMFANGINISSAGSPTVCTAKPGVPGEASVCAQISSQYYKTWLFPEYKFSIKSPTDPIMKDGIWQFESGAQIQGEASLEFLAAQIGFTLPE